MPLDWLSSLTSFLAQTPPPPVDEMELMRQQMLFLQDANANLTRSFDRYISLVQLTLATAGGIVAIIGVLGAAISIKSLKDFYATLNAVQDKVRDEVDRSLAVALKRDRSRLNRLEDILAREDLPGRLSIDYVVPAPAPQRLPQGMNLLLKALKRRGFENVMVRHEPGLRSSDPLGQVGRFSADIVVLDLHHADLEPNQADQVIEAAATRFPSGQAALVVYGSGRYNAVPALNQQGTYCVVSNGPPTFVARVLETAYLMDAVQAG